MSYYITVHTTIPFQDAIDQVTEELKKEGFGVITTIDVKSIKIGFGGITGIYKDLVDLKMGRFH